MMTFYQAGGLVLSQKASTNTALKYNALELVLPQLLLPSRRHPESHIGTILVPAVPLPIKDLCEHTWKNSKGYPESLGPCQLCGSPGWSSRILPSAWPSPSLCSHLRSEQPDETFLSLCVMSVPLVLFLSHPHLSLLPLPLPFSLLTVFQLN